jgi:hypothetical protein
MFCLFIASGNLGGENRPRLLRGSHGFGDMDDSIQGKLNLQGIHLASLRNFWCPHISSSMSSLGFRSSFALFDLPFSFLHSYFVWLLLPLALFTSHTSPSVSWTQDSTLTGLSQWRQLPELKGKRLVRNRLAPEINSTDSMDLTSDGRQMCPRLLHGENLHSPCTFVMDISCPAIPPWNENCRHLTHGKEKTKQNKTKQTKIKTKQQQKESYLEIG